ncbi:hypothetical protein JCM14469_27280 [Desulfatiferula olefinivorans]
MPFAMVRSRSGIHFSFVLFESFRERSDRVVEWFDHEAHEEHEGKEPGLISVMTGDAHRSVAVRHAPACPDLLFVSL